MSEANFAGRVALVTGGSRCIGRATALRLAEEGADVAISYATREDEAAAVVDEIKRLGRRALPIRCDVSRPDDVNGMVESVRKALGPIDLLAHCGAISNICEHTELTWEVWRETIDVNLNGTYLVLFAVKDEMIARRFGRVVLVSSIAAFRPRPKQFHYSASKLGMVALARSAAEAFGPHNVRVNCVAPGLTDTAMMRVFTQQVIDNVASETPLRRVAQPEEIAAVIRFLLSEDSSFITGQVVTADGGRVMF
ncbi:MAG: SDR family oxidoreductase [Pirellulales bacterium]|nr:SDR family oxidoreductase [Pirellulales bacterium]